MKTLFTFLSIFISTLICSQSLDCIKSLSVAVNENGEAEIFAVDLLAEFANVSLDDFIITIDSGDPSPKISLTTDDIGIHSYVVKNTVTGETCQGEIIVGESSSTSVIAVCESHVLFNYSDSHTSIRIQDIDGGSNLDSEGLVSSLSLEQSPTTSPSDESFQSLESIEFTSSDVCEIVYVFLHIWDETGTLNSCWTEVKVKGAEDCNFEEASVCDDKCDDGTSFDPYSIKWPLSFDVVDTKAYQRGCKGLTEIEMKSLGKLVCDGKYEHVLPTWCETACGLIGYSYEEKIVNHQDATCDNIERSWVIIDWCTYDPKSPNSDTNQDSYGLIEELNDNECASCGDLDLYIGYVEVQPDGYYSYEQVINFDETSGLVSDELPVTIDQISGTFDMTSFGFDINGTNLTLRDNGTFSIPESAITDGTNVLSLKTLTGSNVLNGVSTLDLVLGLQYIIGLRELKPEQIIAADINKSGDVSVAQDLIQLRNLILGNASDINGEHWFIVPQNQDFSSFNGFEFDNSFSSYTFQKEELDMEKGLTLAIHKYGDLNDSHSYSRSGERAKIHFNNKKLKKGEELVVELTLSGDQIGKFIAAQVGLVFKGIVLKDVKHEYGNEFDYNISDNSLRFIYNDNENPLSELKLELIVEAITSGELTDFIKLDNTFTTEYITADLDLFEIELVIGEISPQSALLPSTDLPEISNFSIYPNPATGSFRIFSTSDVIGKTMNIYNAIGQLEHTQDLRQLNSEINSEKLTTGLKIVVLEDAGSQKLMIKN